MAGGRGSLSDVRYLSSRERGLLRQGSGPARHTLGSVYHLLGALRQTFGFDLKTRVFAFFLSETSEISNFITLPILSELSP